MTNSTSIGAAIRNPFGHVLEIMPLRGSSGFIQGSSVVNVVGFVELNRLTKSWVPLHFGQQSPSVVAFLSDDTQPYINFQFMKPYSLFLGLSSFKNFH